jgi:hypothetical protein
MAGLAQQETKDDGSRKQSNHAAWAISIIFLSLIFYM